MQKVPLALVLALASITAASAHAEEALKADSVSAARSAFFLGTGLYRAGNLGSSRAFFGINLGYQRKIEEDFEIRLLIDDEYQTNDLSNSNYIFYGVGLNFVFKNEETTPVVGFEIGHASATAAYQPDLTGSAYPTDETSGVATAVKAGYRFFAHSGFPLETDLRYTQMYFGSNYFGNPRLVGLSLSVFL